MSNQNTPADLQQEQPSRAMALASEESKALIEVLSGVFGQMKSRSLSNFDGDKKSQYRLTSLATGPDCRTALDVQNKDIAIEYWYVHPVEMVNQETGELSEATRCVLIEPGGKAVAFVSDGVAGDLGRLVSCYGLEKYSPPVKVRLREVQTAGKRRMYKLQPV